MEEVDLDQDIEETVQLGMMESTDDSKGNGSAATSQEGAEGMTT